MRLPRAELTGRVAGSLRTGSVVLTAGAGYGKSTSIDLAVERLGWTSARVSCDEALADAGRLLTRLVAALQSGVPGLADVVADRIAAGAGPLDVAAATDVLLAEIGRLLVDPLVVVIDDAEALAGAPDALALVNAVLAASGERLHVAVASRRRLRLRVAKLRTAGRLAEFGEADLAFSPHECAEYMRHRLGRAADPEEHEAVVAATHGWPLGVALAGGASLPPAGAPPAGLFDYLAEEVLDRLDEGPRAAVLDSAVVTQLERETLTRLGLPPDLAEQARDAGLLLEPAGQDGWRYHPLLREFLLSRARAERDYGALCERAAEAEAAAGRPAEGVHLLLAAGRYERAAAAIAEVGQIMMRASWRTIRGWLDQLPERLRDEPGLRLLEGQVLLAEGDQARADAVLLAAEAAFRARGEVAGEWAARWFRAAAYHEAGRWQEISALADDFDRGVALRAGPPGLALGLWGAFAKAAYGRVDDAKALAELVTAQPGAEALAHIEVGFRGYIEVPAGGIDGVVELARRVGGRVGDQDPLGVRPIVNASLALMLFEQGRNEAALESWSRTIEEVDRLGAARGITVSAHIGRAIQLALLGRPAEAEQALARAEPLPAMGFRETWVHQARAAIAWRRGDAGGAAAACERAYELVRDARVTSDRSWALLTIVPVLAGVGEIDRARAIVEETLVFWDEVLPGDRARFWRARSLAQRAWLRHLQGETDDAARDLEQAWQLARGVEAHIVRGDWPHLRPVLWSALELGVIEPAAAIAVMRAAQIPDEDLAGFLEHPVPAVRRVAIGPAAASGHPRSYTLLGGLAEAGDRDAEDAIRRLRDEPPPLTITLLGGFGVRRGEWEVEPAAWQRPTAAALVRFLLVRVEAAVPEDDLFEALWPGRPEGTARASLRVALARARSVLDLPAAAESRIVSVRRTFRINLGRRDSVDAEEFARAAAAARSARGSARIDALERAAALWTGEPLPEDRYSDWAQSWRDDLIGRHTEVLAALVRARLQAGDNAAAVAAARRLVEADPLDESSHQQLMLAYARAGNRSAALRQYLACRGTLVEELGIEPSRATMELHGRLLAGEPV